MLCLDQGQMRHSPRPSHFRSLRRSAPKAATANDDDLHIFLSRLVRIAGRMWSPIREIPNRKPPFQGVIRPQFVTALGSRPLSVTQSSPDPS